jgi:hypothetical protein
MQKWRGGAAPKLEKIQSKLTDFPKINSFPAGNGEYYFSNPDACATRPGHRVYKYTNWLPHFQWHPVPEMPGPGFFFANRSVFYNAPDGCGVTFVAYMEQTIRHPTKHRLLWLLYTINCRGTCRPTN